MSTTKQEVAFRLWFNKFKEDNQVVFGLASEFRECYESAIEDYKASLVPVMWWDGDSDYPDDIMSPSIRQSHIDKNSSMYLDYPIPLYALLIGETK